MSSQVETYQEIGVVVELPENWVHIARLKAGDKVYFDSWLAVKFPKEGTTDEYYWLVKWEDVRAVEYAEQPISE